MWLISTFFDESVRGPKAPRPVVSVACNKRTGKVYEIELFVKGAKYDLLMVKNRLKAIAKILNSNEPVTINDLKAHLDAFDAFGIDINPNDDCQIYSRPETLICSKEIIPQDKIKECKKSISAVLKSDNPLPVWQKLNAQACFVYYAVQKRGFFDGIKSNHPHYTLNSFSGRPIATEYTIFNQSGDSCILPNDLTHTHFIHFDWIAADFRAGSILSQDQRMLASFKESDPYTHLSLHLQKDRSECKKLLLVATNALNPESPAFNHFSRFRDWILESIADLHANKFLSSLLGRKFSYNDVDDQHEQDKRILNAVLQGTVVHAMQSSIWMIYRKFGTHFLTDRYDSIIMTADESTLDFIIRHVSEIMYRPFIFYPDLPQEIRQVTFPVAVSIGTKWGQYEHKEDIR